MALQVEPRAVVRRHNLTLDEYERMCEAGIFEPEASVELIRGEVIDMPPPGPEHEAAVSRLNLMLGELLGRRAIVWPQGNSLRLPKSASRPQPDVTILQWRDDHYAKKRPFPEDVILLIEVSQSSLRYDRGEKLTLYAEASIPEYWLVNLVDGLVELYSDPQDGKYASIGQVRRGETLSLPGGLEGSIAVEDILGKI